MRIIALFLPWIQSGCVGPQDEGETKKPCDPGIFMEEYHRRHPEYYATDADALDAGMADAGRDAGNADVYIGE